MMIHYPLGYDVKANCIPSPRSAELCEPRFATALSRPELGPEGGNCTGRYARGGRRSSSLQPNIYTFTTLNIDKDFLCV